MIISPRQVSCVARLALATPGWIASQSRSNASSRTWRVSSAAARGQTPSDPSCRSIRERAWSSRSAVTVDGAARPALGSRLSGPSGSHRTVHGCPGSHPRRHLRSALSTCRSCDGKCRLPPGRHRQRALATPSASTSAFVPEDHPPRCEAHPFRDGAGAPLRCRPPPGLRGTCQESPSTPLAAADRSPGQQIEHP